MRKPVKLTLTPHDYQHRFLDAARQLITNDPQNWHLFSAPTGTGKSIMELMLLQADPNALLITPRLEIIAGMMTKLGFYVEDMTDEKLVSLSLQYGIITPIRLRTLLANGTFLWQVSTVIVDECHHSNADTYQDIYMYLNGCPKIGLTATPYRGTPRSTKKFHEQWNNTINVILTLEDAVRNGYCTIPQVEVWPLVDDDVITIVGGEFQVSSAEPMIRARIDSIVEHSKRFYCPRSRMWDRPTMYAVPSSTLAIELTKALSEANLPAVKVTQDTPRNRRQQAFQGTVSCQCALVQIDVVSEGVDLPIRRLIDCKPTMSPVRWLQQIGRITRPSEEPPHYICICRNLERHCYLMEGLLPNSKIAEAQTAFNTSTQPFNFSSRSGIRAVGLEGMGRFTITPVQLLSGLTVFTYHLVSTEEFKRNEYFVIVHPNHPEPTIGIKESTYNSEKEMSWGKWRLIDSIPDVTGCRSAKAGELTDKQRTWWTKSAEAFGLNPHSTVDNRKFGILPFLTNTGLNFRKQ